MAMGAADVVPGVSGGTIALITGIYQELIESIQSIDHNAVKTLFKKGPLAAWNQINGSFLLSVLTGIAISVLSLVKLIHFFLENYPVLIWAFFFGLILASAFCGWKASETMEHWPHREYNNWRWYCPLD